MAKEIIFEEPKRDTKISIRFNEGIEGDEDQLPEVMIECAYDGVEGWHSFNDANELQDFINELQKLQGQLKSATILNK